MPRYRIAALLTAVAAALPLAACGTGAGGAPEATTEAQSAPIIATNCGMEFRLDTPARRAVTLEQGQTETLLALGAAKQMAGTSHLKDAIRPEWQEAYDSVPVLSKEPANGEQIRAADADFIFSGFAANYTRGKAGDRQEWKDLGVVPFLSNTECRDVTDNAGQNAFQLMEKDYQELGSFFDKPEQAEELIAQQRQAIEAAQRTADSLQDRPRMALFYSSYEGAPYIGGKKSLAQDMFDFLGATNVFADVNEDWPTVSWESFADRNPEVIVLADMSKRGYPGDTYQEKIKELEDNPATRNLDAVRNHRFIVVPAIGLSPNVRSSEVLTILADALAGGVDDAIAGATAGGKL